MLVTVDNADGKLCCGPRGADPDKNGDGDHSVCEGDCCMAWRWHMNVQREGGCVETSRSDKGYCGLAGKPE